MSQIFRSEGSRLRRGHRTAGDGRGLWTVRLAVTLDRTPEPVAERYGGGLSVWQRVSSKLQVPPDFQPWTRAPDSPSQGALTEQLWCSTQKKAW